MWQSTEVNHHGMQAFVGQATCTMREMSAPPATDVLFPEDPTLALAIPVPTLALAAARYLADQVARHRSPCY